MGQETSRRPGRGCGKVQVGDDGVRRGCGVGEREDRWQGLWEMRLEVDAMWGPGREWEGLRVPLRAPGGGRRLHGSQARGARFGGKLWSPRRCLLGLSLPHLPSVRGFFSSFYV